MRQNIKTWLGGALLVAAFGLQGCDNSAEPAANQLEPSADLATAVPSASSDDVEELQRLANDAAAIEASEAPPSQAAIAP